MLYKFEKTVIYSIEKGQTSVIYTECLSFRNITLRGRKQHTKTLFDSISMKFKQVVNTNIWRRIVIFFVGGYVQEVVNFLIRVMVQQVCSVFIKMYRTVTQNLCIFLHTFVYKQNRSNRHSLKMQHQFFWDIFQDVLLYQQDRQRPYLFVFARIVLFYFLIGR